MSDSESDLEQRLTEAGLELEQVQAGLADAEARVSTQREEIAQLKQRLAESDGLLQGSRAELGEAATKYREARLALLPEVPPELVSGSTLAEVDQQLDAAQRIAQQVRERLQAESQSASGGRVPAGSPPRRPPDMSGLSTQEKIRAGLEERGRQ